MALNKEKCEEHLRSNVAQNSNVPRSQEDYTTQVSEEIEGRVTEKFSQQFRRTENRILDALARLDDFLMNRLIQGHFVNAPEMPRNAISTGLATNEDDSQSNPHPEAGIFNNQLTQNSGPEDGNDKPMSSSVLGVTACSGVPIFYLKAPQNLMQKIWVSLGRRICAWELDICHCKFQTTSEISKPAVFVMTFVFSFR